ncbi:MAG: hypothetical protein KAG97_06405 [Victivallales bacterium]|nr:hypothetical protein [Victivallales bacterium]
MTNPAKNDIEKQAEKRLLSLRTFGIKLGLEQTKELFTRLGNPHKNLKFIHVAGTNGKGSICAMISAGLSAAGFKTGFYSSPHLIKVRERFRIDGKSIPPARFAEMVEQVMPVINGMRRDGFSVTYFEATTAIAALAFASAGAKFAVWETGMGGRFDATNIVDPELCMITSIAVEHTRHLGTTPAEIAFEKAGIIKPGVPLYCGHIPEDAREVIERRARELDAPCVFSNDLNDYNEKANRSHNLKPLSTSKSSIDFPPQPKSLIPNDFRTKNLNLAKLAIKHLSAKFAFPSVPALEAAKTAKWPGRLHEVGDSTIVDGAHNPAAFDALLPVLKSERPGVKWTIILALLDDKDASPILRKLALIANEFILPRITSTDRAVPPAELAAQISSFSSVPAKLAPDVRSALEATSDSPNRLVVGSLYLAGEALSELLPIENVTGASCKKPSEACCERMGC